jgi:hypothetical protein
MGIHFCLNRERMFKEVAQCIALGRLGTLMSFCNSCSFKLVEDGPVPECHNCKIQRGIKTLLNREKNRRNKPIVHLACRC